MFGLGNQPRVSPAVYAIESMAVVALVEQRLQELEVSSG
jgi:hypothetical protein